jgi:hypothetical protein
MFKEINGEVEFDFEAFFESIREYKEFIRGDIQKVLKK